MLPLLLTLAFGERLFVPLIPVAQTRAYGSVAVVPHGPAAGVAPRARPAQALGGGEEKMPIGELLRKYGVVGLVFHFTVWVSCLAVVYALLAGNVDISWVLERLPGAGALGDAGEAAGRAGATLAIVEAVGPLRLALTVAATPRIAKALGVGQDDEPGQPDVVGVVRPFQAVRKESKRK